MIKVESSGAIEVAQAPSFVRMAWTSAVAAARATSTRERINTVPVEDIHDGTIVRGIRILSELRSAERDAGSIAA